MIITKRTFDKNYPYEIHDAWDGVIYLDKEDLKDLYREIEKIFNEQQN